MTTASRHLAKIDLAGPDDRHLQATGTFYLRGAVHNVTFDNADGVVTRLGLLESEGDDDVTLVHDSWNPGDTALPPESFISVPELRPAVVEFAAGDVLPPPSVQWASVPDVGWS